MLFLGVYMVTLVGNGSIIMWIRISSQLHTLLHLFLSHLAFIDIVYSTSVSVIMALGLLGNGLTLPRAAYEVQLCITVSFGSVECFLLAAMASDGDVTICSPLLYSTLMYPRVCFLLLGSSYVGGCMNGWTFTGC